MELPFDKKFDFDRLFTFEMANNHQGSVAHGKRIISEMATIAKEHNIKVAVKLQFRDLKTFIHPSFRDKKDAKHIPRFLSTELSKKEFGELVEETKKQGLISMATPFDESSVDLLEELDVEIIKVASCSAHDWPLLEKISTIGKPVIVSVGGLDIKGIDSVVSFFEHRGIYFALMHCVAIYPTPDEKLELDFIEVLKNRYPHLTIGFSTHEPPNNADAIKIAYAKGARIFERHVGVPTAKIKLNAYSSDPDQVRSWIKSFKKAEAMSGNSSINSGRKIEDAELNDLRSLMRGVFAKEAIKKGQEIKRENVFFAMPLVSDIHLKSGQFQNSLVADRAYKAGEAMDITILSSTPRKKDIIYSTVHTIKGMLNAARIHLSHDFTVDISHHYGLESFSEVGCVIINCINREYAKKLIIQLPGQLHPIHYHKIKDESFHVLYGTVEMIVEGKKKLLYPGDTLWMPRGVWHGFRTDTGVIFEEISTTSLEDKGDSYYIDKNISKKPREERKTKLLNWGRHQFE